MSMILWCAIWISADHLGIVQGGPKESLAVHGFFSGRFTGQNIPTPSKIATEQILGGLF